MLRLTVLIVSMAATGCSWQQAYSSAQGWQRNQCYRLVEQTERDRCLSNANMAYEEYERQTDRAKKDEDVSARGTNTSK